MSEPFMAEIRIFAGNFPIRGWAFCDGQILPIAQYSALFSLLGTTYGGNGTTNFALPNFSGRAAMAAGNGPGLTPRVLGETSGENAVTLLQTEMPIHNHALNGFGGFPDESTPSPTVGVGSFSQTIYGNPSSVNMQPMAVSITGSSFPHNNMQPYLGLTFLIAMVGIYPSRG